MKDFLKFIALLAILLGSCALAQADNISDLTALPSGGAAATHWNVDAFDFSLYHVKQVRDGHRVIPCLKFPDAGRQYNAQYNLWEPNVKDALNATADWTYLRDKNLPFGLRSNQIQEDFLLTDVATIPAEESALVTGTVNGVFKRQKVVDRLGPISKWTEAGQRWATSKEMVEILRLYPNPPWVVWMENNEMTQGEDDPDKRYVMGDRFKGVVWRPDAAQLNIRMASIVSGDAMRFVGQSGLLRQAQYTALYDTFAAATWPGKLYTAGYGPPFGDAQGAMPGHNHDIIGYSPQAMSYDWPGPFHYLLNSNTPLTSASTEDQWSSTMRVLNLRPAWKWLSARNPKFARNLFVSLYQGYAAVQDITPERYEGLCQWYLWALRSPGDPFILTYWNGSSRKPTDILYQTFTEHDYFKSVMDSCDRAMSSKFREFFLQGNPVLNPAWHHVDVERNKNLNRKPYPNAGDDDRNVFLECSANTAYVDWFDPPLFQKINLRPNVRVNVWAIATELNGDYLLYAWTPNNTTTTRVIVPGAGEFEIDFGGAAFGYWLIEPPKNVYTIKKVD